MVILILAAVACFLVLLIIYSIRYTQNSMVSFFIASVLSAVALTSSYYFVNGRVNLNNAYLLRLFIPAVGGAVLYGFFYGQKGNTSGSGPKGDFIDLETVGGKKIVFRNPFDNFLVYGGQGAGKTKSVGKHLLYHYIRLHWAGFIFDFKDGDYTKTAFELVKRHNYPHSVYHVNFINPSCSHRVNLIKPSVVKDPNFFIQLMADILIANMGESKQDEWFLGALGIWRGVAVRFYMDYPHICTIPHIVNFIVQSNSDANRSQRLQTFLQARPESRGLAFAYLAAEGSERTQASMRATLGNYISALSFNKNVQYILSGDDFDYNLIDPKDPKLLIVANSFQQEAILGPIISLMVTLSARAFTMQNRIKFFNFLDEATTFKIPNFERMLSLLREYLVSFVILTQSPAKIEKLYGELDLRAIEANCGNKFFGRSLDVKGAESSSKQFSRRDEVKVTRTTGQSTNNTSSSKSISQTKEQRYDPDFFMQLKPGQFVGRAQNSNYKEFNFMFKQYVPGDEKDPSVVRLVLDSDIDDNYDKIINEVMNLE
ncbi:type IV secretory system conjugative DNA transfer family protein [Chitinophaga polysaccharea]|nr:type IV secretion system DNA-binding domain-containing protein [Chitinophaga polysaccharea]